MIKNGILENGILSMADIHDGLEAIKRNLKAKDRAKMTLQKSVLTNKQKKARNKSKKAKLARKLNK